MDFYTKSPKFRFFTTNKPTFHFKFRHESQFSVIIGTGSYNVFHFYAKLLIQRDRIKTFLYYASTGIDSQKKVWLYLTKKLLLNCAFLQNSTFVRHFWHKNIEGKIEYKMSIVTAACSFGFLCIFILNWPCIIKYSGLK